MEIEVKKGENMFFVGQDEMNPEGYVSFKLDDDGDLIVDSTEVADSLAGQGMGSRLVHTVVDHAKQEGRMITPTCPFARAVMEKDNATRELIKD